MTKFDPITGRYIHLTIQGVEYRVFYEEAGKGIPIICQHSGGGDGLEWAALLNDPEVTSKYHVIYPITVNPSLPNPSNVAAGIPIDEKLFYGFRTGT